MNTHDQDARAPIILGQKYAYATASLILGIASFTNLLGLEKPLLAIVFAWLALKHTPPPVLRDRRLWAKTGLILGSVVLILVPTILILNIDRLRAVVDCLIKLSNAK